MRYVFLICCCFFLVSCKKDKLKGENSILIGQWYWLYTEHSYGWCNDMPDYETIFASSQSIIYSVEFLKSGKVIFYENGEITKKHRIVFNYFEKANDGAYYFYFYLDNDLEKGMAGSVHGDTLHFDYPLAPTDPNCENYLNFFVRE